MSPKAAPDYAGLTKAARAIAQTENLSKAMATVADAVERMAETCWTDGCDKPQSPDHVGYWCEEHYLARRSRIQAEMAKIKNDSNGIPRKSAVPDAPQQCLGQTKAGKRCARKGWADAHGYLCPTHLWQDGVE